MALRYPIGKQDFASLREGGFAYVDKTGYIPLLLEGANYYFLSRPRRFGKSLFVSTLENFFLGRRELFAGLAIDKYEKWDWQPYPVIHMDFAESNYTEAGYLEAAISHILTKHEIKYGISTEGAMNINERFARLISGLYDKYSQKVVVLVDEYEKPVIDNISNKALRESIRETLRGFYGVLKSYDRQLQFVLLTGITKFGQLSVFSALNNLNDISLDIDYGAICGITEDELLENFSEGIQNIAKAENVSFDEALALLKTNYDGYHFSASCPDIYNPFSILSVLSKREIKPYWSVTGNPSLLADLLVLKNYNIENLDGIKARAERLMDVGNQFDDPVALFYQAGYLTIRDYDKATRRYTLGFPNKEVELAFFGYVLPFYQKPRREDRDSYINDFADGILEGEPEKTVKALMAFSASINYELIPAPETERHFQSMMYIFSRLILPYAAEVKTEDRTSDGRIDLLIKTARYVYIIEIKRDSTAQAALRQIEEKDYARQFASDPRKAYLIGLNFSTSSKRLDAYEIQGGWEIRSQGR